MWHKSSIVCYQCLKSEWQSWTPLPVPFHINIPWWVWKNVLISCVISPTFFPVSTGWFSVFVLENTNLVLQGTKAILFSAAYEGLRSACYIVKSVDEDVNWELSFSCQKRNINQSLCLAVALVSSFMTELQLGILQQSLKYSDTLQNN